jgi:hypothetical protein
LAPAVHILDLPKYNILHWIGHLSKYEFDFLFGKKDFLASTEFIQKFAPWLCQSCPVCCEDVLLAAVGVCSK